MRTVVSEPAYGIDRAAFNQGRNAQYKPSSRRNSSRRLRRKAPARLRACVVLSADEAESHASGRRDVEHDGQRHDTGYQNGLVEPANAVEVNADRVRRSRASRLVVDDLGTDEPPTPRLLLGRTYGKASCDNGRSSSRRREEKIVKWLQAPHSDAGVQNGGNGVLCRGIFVLGSG
jgi:DNA (cytosine-5)-methyltransferase 1